MNEYHIYTNKKIPQKIIDEMILKYDGIQKKDQTKELRIETMNNVNKIIDLVNTNNQQVYTLEMIKNYFGWNLRTTLRYIQILKNNPRIEVKKILYKNKPKWYIASSKELFKLIAK